MHNIEAQSAIFNFFLNIFTIRYYDYLANLHRSKLSYTARLYNEFSKKEMFQMHLSLNYRKAYKDI